MQGNGISTSKTWHKRWMQVPVCRDALEMERVIGGSTAGGNGKGTSTGESSRQREGAFERQVLNSRLYKPS